MLCSLALTFPRFVENFLDLSNGLSRRFREETVTDMFMSNMVAMGGNRVIVDFPDEPATGADMEWNFVNQTDGSFVRLLIQAKRSYGVGKKWRRHSYRQLFHKTGNPAQLQAKIICTTSRTAPVPTYPLYMLFTPGRTCRMARHDGERCVEGVTLADGYAVEKLAVGAVDRRTSTENRSLKKISELMFSLERIFCPTSLHRMGPMAFSNSRGVGPLFWVGSTIGFPIPPSPQEICERINEMRRSKTPQDVDLDARIPLKVGQEIPSEIRQAMERRRFPQSSDRKERPRRIVFVSQDPPGD